MSTIRHDPGHDTGRMAISVWENEGGAACRSRMDEQFGRRIEQDRTWTIYHVYTGVPASSDGSDMTGLSRMDATDGMLFLNNRNSERRLRRSTRRETPQNRLSAFLLSAWRKTGGLSWH
nr:hypothetical protein [Stappia indica]